MTHVSKKVHNAVRVETNLPTARPPSASPQSPPSQRIRPRTTSPQSSGLQPPLSGQEVPLLAAVPSASIHSEPQHELSTAVSSSWTNGILSPSSRPTDIHHNVSSPSTIPFHRFQPPPAESMVGGQAFSMEQTFVSHTQLHGSSRDLADSSSTSQSGSMCNSRGGSITSSNTNVCNLRPVRVVAALRSPHAAATRSNSSAASTPRASSSRGGTPRGPPFLPSSSMKSECPSITQFQGAVFETSNAYSLVEHSISGRGMRDLEDDEFLAGDALFSTLGEADEREEALVNRNHRHVVRNNNTPQTRPPLPMPPQPVLNADAFPKSPSDQSSVTSPADATRRVLSPPNEVKGTASLPTGMMRPSPPTNDFSPTHRHGGRSNHGTAALVSSTAVRSTSSNMDDTHSTGRYETHTNTSSGKSTVGGTSVDSLLLYDHHGTSLPPHPSPFVAGHTATLPLRQPPLLSDSPISKPSVPSRSPNPPIALQLGNESGSGNRKVVRYFSEDMLMD